MTFIRPLWLISAFLCLLTGTKAVAKIFDFSKGKMAAYVGGSWGPSFENTLNSKSNSDTATTVRMNSDHPYNLSGEFGFMFGEGVIHAGFGFEVVKPKDLIQETGKTPAGAELYSMTSEISVLVPKGRLEVTLKRWSKARFFVGGEAGWAYLIARNSYSFTPAGTTAFSGLADFYEDLRANAPMYGGSLGFEKVLSDTTSFLIFAGYRSLYFTEVNHNRDTTTFQGNVSKGDLARNINGSNRTLDLTGMTAGLSLRFWLR